MFIDLEHGARQSRFREHLADGRAAATVTDPSNLEAQLLHALHELPAPPRVPDDRAWVLWLLALLMLMRPSPLELRVDD